VATSFIGGAIAKVRIHWRDAGYFQFSQMPAWAF
jgi:hypothetical protein